MKKKILSIILSAILFVTGAWLVACKNDETEPEETPTVAETTELLLSATTKTLILGDEYKLFVVSTAHKESAITWTSSNTSVATVDGGEIFTQTTGETVITATAENGDTATCSIFVTTGGKVPVLAFENAYQDVITVNRQERVNLKGYVLFNGKTFTDASLSYTQTNDSVGDLTEGVFIPKSVGETTVTVTASWHGVQSELLTKVFIIQVI